MHPTLPFRSVGVLAAGAGLLAASMASAAIITGGGITLAESGGTFDAGNLAIAGAAFAPDIEGQNGGTPTQPTGYSGAHTTTGVNNGVYGNTGAWLAGSNGSHIGLNLNGSFSVASIAYGRSNTGDFGDRQLGLVTVQYTTDAVPASGSTWTTIGTTDYTGAGIDFSQADRHRFNFSPVVATGVRLVMANFGRGVDEFEVYSSTLDAPTLVLNTPVVVEETAAGRFTGLPFQGTAIPFEPAPGDGQYHYANGPGQYTHVPFLQGSNVTVETSWGVSFNHTQDADYFFDEDGPGPIPEIALSQNVNQTLLNDQSIAPVGVEWSGFFTLGTGLNLNANSVFRVVSTNVVGGSAPEALTSAVWRFTAVPEPTSLALLALAAPALLRRRSR